MKLGIVGLPNVGKSTLFNSLTKAGALSANYPFATIDPNVGIVSVPDERIVKLGELYHTKKVTPATIEFVDIAGLVKGASKGEGLGNQFLANIREVDAIVHVVRCFEDTNIIHVDGSIDPARDIETINLELIFSDIEILDRRIAKIAKQARMDKTLAKELELVEAVKKHLEDGKMARTFEVPDDDDAQIWFKGYNLLTAKPTIYAANVAEDDLADDGASNPHVAKVREMAKEEGAEVFVICAQIEQELAELDEDEKKEYLEDLGVESSGLDKLVAASYSLLGLISFLTAGEDECRAWTIKKGTKAPQAAGKIHTDFERGFIKAEVVNYQDLLWCGDYYYVLGYSEKKSKVINFRVDRIASKPEILNKDIIPMPDDFDIENYTKEVFFMFSGEKVLVDLRCDNSLMKTMVDRFGEDVTTLAYDMTSFRVQTEVSASPTFFGWVFGFNGKVQILAPESVKEQYRQMIAKADEDMQESE